jgi:hypothetical protein
MFLQPLIFDKKNDWILARITFYKQDLKLRGKQLSAAVVLLLVTLALGILSRSHGVNCSHMGNQNRLHVA